MESRPNKWRERLAPWLADFEALRGWRGWLAVCLFTAAITAVVMSPFAIGMAIRMLMPDPGR